MPTYAVPVPDEAEAVWSFECASGLEALTIASNVELEVWIERDDGRGLRFAGDGGHRCARGEVLADAWPECADAKRVVVKARFIDPARTECLHRDVFADAFVSFSSGAWTIARDTSLAFRAKCSGQLPRQCVVLATPAEAQREAEELALDDWRVVPSPLKRARFVDVAPRLLESREVARVDGWAPHDASDVGAYVRSALAQSQGAALMCATFDLGSIALHRFEMDTRALGSSALVYSEVPRIEDAWATRSRSKVNLVDAAHAGLAHAALFGARGCRYVHVLSCAPEAPALQAQRREYPLVWRDVEVEPGLEPVVEACRANLVACVDGGVVDTCWRERAQWTGDLRMSSIALRALCENTEVTALALHQIALSYDAERAMVKGVAPVHNTQHDLFIPQFHLAFCLAALEHDKRLMRDDVVARAVHESVEAWREQHVRDDLLQHIRGWSFTDWDVDDERHEGKECPEAPNAIVNAWWMELCARIGAPSGVTRTSFDAAFRRDVGYGLFAGDGRSSLHATAVAARCADKKHALAHLDTERTAIARRVTPYFAYFVALAFAERSRDDALAFARDYYGPIAARHGTLVERANDDYSLAHGWSVAIAALAMKRAA